MEQFRNAAAAHGGVVRAGLDKEIDALHTDYQLLRGDQLGRKGAAAAGRGERDDARAALAMQLWKNILTISLAHLGDSGAAMAYFDESIIK